MSEKTYVVRRKIVRIHPTPIPETTYKPETFTPKSKAEPIQPSDPRMEELAKPKPKIQYEEPLNLIPQYQNPPPEFEPVDFRVNAAVLHRDVHLMREFSKKEATEKANEPTEFLEWQAKMRALDEQKRVEEIQKRHEDLDHVRRRAIKAKKIQIKERLAVGQNMRIQFSEEITAVQREIQQERDKIKELKGQLIDKAPQAVAKMQKKRIEATKEMKKQLRKDMKEAQKRRTDEEAELKKNAAKVREDVANHVIAHGDKYSSKVEITETKFLAALTDEEAQQLLDCHAEEKRNKIEEEIQLHRELKEAKMDKLVKMLEEATQYRDEREAAHVQKRKEKLAEEAALKAEKEQIEDQKMLELEKKLEKKRKARIKEAEEMEEHTRQIAARNRYLALNKKALATKVFQSQQDAKLRSAKERQNNKMPEGTTRIQSTRAKQGAELTNLKSLLGLK